ncbi:MAG: KH domain-containing protein [Actinomycetota bacterium]
MKELLEFIAKELVDEPDKVHVEEIVDDRGVLLELTVAESDMGKVIGRAGRLARAIRTVVKAAAIRTGQRVQVDIVDPE